jgi:hypothetical protein
MLVIILYYLLVMVYNMLLYFTQSFNYLIEVKQNTFILLYRSVKRNNIFKLIKAHDLGLCKPLLPTIYSVVEKSLFKLYTK